MPRLRKITQEKSGIPEGLFRIFGHVLLGTSVLPEKRKSLTTHFGSSGSGSFKVLSLRL
jgi:hypothetical protein